MISRDWIPIGILATFALSLLATAAEPGLAIIKLAAGEQRSYHDDQTITRVAVGDPEIANLTVVSERQLLITGKRPGSTSFTVWYGTGKRPGFTAEVLVTAPDDLADHALAALAADGLRAGEAGAKLKLEGESRSLERHAQAAQVIDDKAPQGVDAAALGFDAQVQIDIKVVEVSRSKLKDAGLFVGKNSRNSTLAISSPGNLRGVESTSEGLFSLLSSSGFLPHLQAFNFVYGNASKGILGTLSLLEGNGFAYTLAEPSLVALSGQSAKFLAGGEFPIPVPNGSSGNAITIQYKEFGVRLTLTPTVLDANRIML
ncbi:MAG: pilus assembly protein N-terminal domain-containing protein, partial [Gammaproteobacteria bacterium]